MKTSRRDFLKSGLFTAIATPSVMSLITSCKETPAATHPFGIQLWTVKEDMAKDPIATLNFLSDYGYKQIESFTGEKGIFWGWSAKDFQKILGDLDMKMISSHINPDFTTDPNTEDEFKAFCDECASIGMTHIFNPFPGIITGSDNWKVLSDGFNRQGEIARSAGLKSGLHTHHMEFIKTPEGDMPFDLLMQNTDSDLAFFELDIYWVAKVGEDPVKWLEKYPGRIPFGHFKDLFKQERIDEIEADPNEPSNDFWPKGASTTLGNGQINFKKILEAAKSTGLDYYIVEQERFDNSNPIADAKINAEYMKNLLL